MGDSFEPGPWLNEAARGVPAREGALLGGSFAASGGKAGEAGESRRGSGGLDKSRPPDVADSPEKGRSLADRRRSIVTRQLQRGATSRLVVDPALPGRHLQIQSSGSFHEPRTRDVPSAGHAELNLGRVLAQKEMARHKSRNGQSIAGDAGTEKGDQKEQAVPSESSKKPSSVELTNVVGQYKAGNHKSRRGSIAPMLFAAFERRASSESEGRDSSRSRPDSGSASGSWAVKQRKQQEKEQQKQADVHKEGHDQEREEDNKESLMDGGRKVVDGTEGDEMESKLGRAIFRTSESLRNIEANQEQGRGGEAPSHRESFNLRRMKGAVAKIQTKLKLVSVIKASAEEMSMLEKKEAELMSQARKSVSEINKLNDLLRSFDTVTKETETRLSTILAQSFKREIERVNFFEVKGKEDLDNALTRFESRDYRGARTQVKRARKCFEMADELGRCLIVLQGLVQQKLNSEAIDSEIPEIPEFAGKLMGTHGKRMTRILANVKAAEDKLERHLAKGGVGTPPDSDHEEDAMGDEEAEADFASSEGGSFKGARPHLTVHEISEIREARRAAKASKPEVEEVEEIEDVVEQEPVILVEEPKAPPTPPPKVEPFLAGSQVLVGRKSLKPKAKKKAAQIIKSRMLTKFIAKAKHEDAKSQEEIENLSLIAQADPRLEAIARGACVGGPGMLSVLIERGTRFSKTTEEVAQISRSTAKMRPKALPHPHPGASSIYIDAPPTRSGHPNVKSAPHSGGHNLKSKAAMPGGDTDLACYFAALADAPPNMRAASYDAMGRERQEAWHARRGGTAGEGEVSFGQLGPGKHMGGKGGKLNKGNERRGHLGQQLMPLHVTTGEWQSDGDGHGAVRMAGPLQGVGLVRAGRSRGARSLSPPHRDTHHPVHAPVLVDQGIISFQVSSDSRMARMQRPMSVDMPGYSGGTGSGMPMGMLGQTADGLMRWGGRVVNDASGREGLGGTRAQTALGWGGGSRSRLGVRDEVMHSESWGVGGVGDSDEVDGGGRESRKGLKESRRVERGLTPKLMPERERGEWGRRGNFPSSSSTSVKYD